MTERYFEISCDVCSEPDWTESWGTVRAHVKISGWRLRGRKAICLGCWEDGRRWKDATIHG